MIWSNLSLASAPFSILLVVDQWHDGQARLYKAVNIHYFPSPFCLVLQYMWTFIKFRCAALAYSVTYHQISECITSFNHLFDDHTSFTLVPRISPILSKNTHRSFHQEKKHMTFRIDFRLEGLLPMYSPTGRFLQEQILSLVSQRRAPVPQHLEVVVRVPWVPSQWSGEVSGKAQLFFSPTLF